VQARGQTELKRAMRAITAINQRMRHDLAMLPPHLPKAAVDQLMRHACEPDRIANVLSRLQAVD